MGVYKVIYSLVYLDSNKKPCVIEDSIEGLTEKQVELLQKIQGNKYMSLGSDFIELDDYDIYGRKLCYSIEVEGVKEENRLLKEKLKAYNRLEATLKLQENKIQEYEDEIKNYKKLLELQQELTTEILKQGIERLCKEDK